MKNQCVKYPLLTALYLYACIQPITTVVRVLFGKIFCAVLFLCKDTATITINLVIGADKISWNKLPKKNVWCTSHLKKGLKKKTVLFWPKKIHLMKSSFEYAHGVKSKEPQTNILIILNIQVTNQSKYLLWNWAAKVKRYTANTLN